MLLIKYHSTIAPTFSVPYRVGGAVHHPAVTIHQVGHVLRHGEAGAGDCQQLGAPRDSELEHGLARLAWVTHHGLETRDVTEVRHVGGLQGERNMKGKYFTQKNKSDCHLHGAVGHVADALLRPNNQLHWNGPARLRKRKYQ